MQNGIPKVPFGFPSGLDYGQKSVIFDPSVITKGVFLLDFRITHKSARNLTLCL